MKLNITTHPKPATHFAFLNKGDWFQRSIYGSDMTFMKIERYTTKCYDGMFEDKNAVDHEGDLVYFGAEEQVVKINNPTLTGTVNS